MENNTKNIVFSGTFLSVNDNAISIEDFKKQIPENTYSITEKKRVHIYKYVYQENFLKNYIWRWICNAKKPKCI